VTGTTDLGGKLASLSPPGERAGRDTAAETVLEPARIAGLLSAITFPPLLVNVALPGVRGLYSSSLLQVNSTSKRILLDVLSPEEGHVQVAPGTVMHVHSRLRGAQFDFATCVIEIQAGDRPLAYLARMPGSVRFHHRRGHPRVHTGYLQDYSMVILGPAADRLPGRLADISAGGMAIVFPRDPGLACGQVISGCRLSLLGGEQLEFCLELVHLRACPVTGELEAGARFLRDEHHDEDRLQRILDKLQRQQLERPPV
jgi:c-di-GMP-binding flagellar brake protein YcgR